MNKKIVTKDPAGVHFLALKRGSLLMGLTCPFTPPVVIPSPITGGAPQVTPRPCNEACPHFHVSEKRAHISCGAEIQEFNLEINENKPGAPHAH